VELLENKSDVAFVERGAPVKVVAVEGMRIVVRAV